jgi:hypothetical protein
LFVRQHSARVPLPARSFGFRRSGSVPYNVCTWHG